MVNKESLSSERKQVSGEERLQKGKLRNKGQQEERKPENALSPPGKINISLFLRDAMKGHLLLKWKYTLEKFILIGSAFWSSLHKKSSLGNLIMPRQDWKATSPASDSRYSVQEPEEGAITSELYMNESRNDFYFRKQNLLVLTETGSPNASN